MSAVGKKKRQMMSAVEGKTRRLLIKEYWTRSWAPSAPTRWGFREVLIY